MTFVGDEGWMVDASTGRMVVILGKSGVQATNHRIYSRDFVGVYAPCASVGVPFFIFISPRSASRFIYFIRLGAPVRWGLLFFLLPLTWASTLFAAALALRVGLPQIAVDALMGVIL